MNKRSERLDELLDVFDKGYSLCAQYDEILHQYGEEVLISQKCISCRRLEIQET